MVKCVTVSETEEGIHKFCVKCKGKHSYQKIIRCEKVGCNNLFHIKCESKDFLADIAKYRQWFCSSDCGEPSSTIELNDSQVQTDELEDTKGGDGKQKVGLSKELKTDKELQAREEQIQKLITSLKKALEANSVLESEFKAYKGESENKLKAMEDEMKAMKLGQVSHASGSSHKCNTSQQQLDSEGNSQKSTIDENFAQIMDEFNQTIGSGKSKATIPSPIDKADDKETNFTFSSKEIKSTVDGHSTATLIARERIRKRRESDKSFSSMDPHAHRSDRDLQRLKLARQNLDELTKFKGDRLEWIAFEEEVYTTWDAGEFSDFEMIKKLRKAIEGDAKAYVKLALNAAEASPELVMETLRRKYYHPNEAVSQALKEITTLEPIRKKVRKPLKSLLTAVESYIHVCRLVKIQQHLDGRVNGEVEAKLPSELRADWNKLIRTGVHESGEKYTGTWIEFWQFMRDSVEDLPVNFESSSANISSRKGPSHNRHNVNQTSTSNPQRGRKSKVNSNNEKIPCPFDDCDKRLYHCTAFWTLPYADKMKFVKDRKLCIKCVNSSTHVAKDCPYKDLVCRASGCKEPKAHASVLHPPATVCCIFQGDGFTSFQVLPIYVFDKHNNPVKILAFMDSGSDTTIMNQSCLDLLELPSQKYQLEVGWCAAGVASIDKASRIFDCDIASLENPNLKFKLMDVVTMRNFKLPYQSQNPHKLKRQFPFLKKVPIPAYDHEMPQILIGLQQRHLMTSEKVVRALDCPVVAEKTALGWTISGAIRQRRDKKVVLQSCLSREDSRDEMTLEELNVVIRKFIDEDISLAKRSEGCYLKPDEKRANMLLDSNMKVIGNRYFVPLLWALDDVELPDNYPLAESRLLAQEIRLHKLNMVDWANEHIRMLLDRKFMRKATQNDLNPIVPHKNVNYVPGFVTFNHNKIPPKPRWVVDPAAKFRGTSLNNVLLKGVDNLVPLTQALFHFRERRFGTVADVEKMYHQVMINPEDQNCQRVLWRWCDSTKKPEIFVHQAMMFGPTDSPSKANAVRIDHATKRREIYPHGARIALDSMYMDDAFNSEDEVADAVNSAQQTIEMFDEICWKLVDFRSNSTEVLKLLPKDRVNENFVIDLAKDETIDKYKVLGIFWDPVRDAFIFKQTAEFALKAKTQSDGYIPTKREVLSFIMRIFDPLGLISHFIVRGRMIMQRTWAEDLDWTSRLTKDIQSMWIEWLNDLDRIAMLVIPRHYNYYSSTVTQVSLHMFSDAGADGFATIAYFRFVYSNGKVHVQQVASKSKVSPIRYLSIAKKELSAAVASVNLAQQIRQQHKRLDIAFVAYYTDSEIALKWIRNPTIRLMQYVAPRVTQIWDETEISEWRYVPTKENPADFGTKWKQQAIDYADHNHMWFQGPQFLWQEQLVYPEDSGYPKQKNMHRVMVVKTNAQDNYYAGILEFINPSIRANWRRYIAAVAGINRFVHNTRLQISNRRSEKNINPVISPAERETATKLIIKIAQRAYWPDVFKSLIAGRFIRTSKSADLNPLNPIISEDGLLRCVTRMSHDDSIPYDQKFPIILPSKHELTESIVRHYHIKHKHVNQDAIIADIREKFWIIHARQAVRRVSANCPYCKLQRSRPYNVSSAPLPEVRTNFTAKAFENTGVDVFGPFTVYTRKSKSSRKVWCVIFCCMITRAVYLRMLDSLSADEMMLAIQDLWTRRGPIKIMLSDNGTNFVGCAAILRTEHLTKLSRDKAITWKFNPPYTPQWGGAWERLIKDIKRSMKSELGDLVVGEKVFQNVLLQVEECMNSRPLTHLPVSPMDNEPLTPNKLIQMHSGRPLILDDKGNIDAELTIKKAQHYASQIRRRWIKEYLPVIANHPPKRLKRISLEEGDYVICIDPLLHPSNWPKGVVKHVYRGRDNIARMADIKLKDGSVLTRRSALRLAKIESSKQSAVEEAIKDTVHLIKQLSLNNEPTTCNLISECNDTTDSHAAPDSHAATVNFNSNQNKRCEEEIFQVTMKPSPNQAIKLAQKLQGLNFYSKNEIINGTTAEVQSLRRLMNNRTRLNDFNLDYALKIVGFPVSVSIMDIIVWLLNKNIRPHWIKCDGIDRNFLHVFVRSNDRERHDELYRSTNLKFNSHHISISRPMNEMNYLLMKGLEHSILSWAPTEWHNAMDLVISRVRDSPTKQRAIQMLDRDYGMLVAKVLRDGIDSVSWDTNQYDVTGLSSIASRINKKSSNNRKRNKQQDDEQTESAKRNENKPTKLRSVIVVPSSSGHSQTLRITMP